MKALLVIVLLAVFVAAVHSEQAEQSVSTERHHRHHHHLHHHHKHHRRHRLRHRRHRSLVDVDVDVNVENQKPITPAAISEFQLKLKQLTEDRVYFHYDTVENAIRWGKKKFIDQGELDFFNGAGTGMAAGGGYYLAEGPVTSSNYGNVPCFITLKQGTYIYDFKKACEFWNVPQGANGASCDPQKEYELRVQLSKAFPLVLNYRTDWGWWIIHNTNTVKSIACGNARCTYRTSNANFTSMDVASCDLNPAKWQSPVKQGEKAVRVMVKWTPSRLGFPFSPAPQPAQWVYPTTPTISNTFELWTVAKELEKGAKLEVAKSDMAAGVSWLRKLWSHQYFIDVISQIRAKNLPDFSNDIFRVFEHDNFVKYQEVFEKYLQFKAVGQSLGIATIDPASGEALFGAPTDTPDTFATRMVALMKTLYKDVSKTDITFRDSVVRAGGDEDGKRFIAPMGQLDILNANRYLVVESAPMPGKPGLFLVNYFYPDPLHLNPALQPKVSAALWSRMKTPGRYPAAEPEKSANFKLDTKALIEELVFDAFASLLTDPESPPNQPRVVLRSPVANKVEYRWKESGGWFGHMKKPVRERVVADTSKYYGSFKIALDLVSIHPCTDYNGRTTRLISIVSAMDAGIDPPVGFMTDFDMMTNVPQYTNFLERSTEAAFQLRRALLSWHIHSLANEQFPAMFNHPEWDRVIKRSLGAFGPLKDGALDLINRQPTGDKADKIKAIYKMVEKRSFVPLLDEILQPGWEGRDRAGAIIPDATPVHGTAKFDDLKLFV